MLFACWSAKGGAGTTAVSCSLAVFLARSHPAGALLVDLGGDAEAVFGCADASGPGLSGWLAEAETATAGGVATVPPPPAELRLGPRLHLLPRGSGPLPSTARSPHLMELLGAERRAVIADCGRLTAGPADEAAAWPALVAGAATHSLLVTRLCYLALRRAARVPLRPSGVVVVSEPRRSLRPVDVAAVVGAPVVADLPYDAGVARAVDAGLLAHRLPASLARAAEVLVA